MQPEDVPLNRSVAPGIYRDRKAWRTVINCVLDIPEIGSAQRHVVKLWPFDTPIEKMQAWRREAKARIEAELQERIEAPLRELERLKKESAPPPRIGNASAASYFALKERVIEAEQEIAQLKASLARQLEVAAAERKRAELAERSRLDALRACARARLP